MIKFKTLTQKTLEIHGLSLNSSTDDFKSFLNRNERILKVNRYQTFVDIAYKIG